MPMLLADVLCGLSYSPTDRPIAEFLAIFPGSFRDTYGVKLVTTRINTQHTNEK